MFTVNTYKFKQKEIFVVTFPFRLADFILFLEEGCLNDA
jgi:hypothetical protein